MGRRRRLQVFVSSTYTDMLEERQAAVQAILEADHIPAGMELFAAGDQSQWDTIKQWIDDSDVFLLLLGGRYGSIEPKSGNSYIDEEFSYALEKQKSPFAVILTEEAIQEKVKRAGGDYAALTEQVHPGRLKALKDRARQHMCKDVDDLKDIKYQVGRSLNKISQEGRHAGWVPGVDMVNLELKVAGLGAENERLQARIRELETAEASSRGPDDMDGRQLTTYLRSRIELGKSLYEWLIENEAEFSLGVQAPYSSDSPPGILYYKIGPLLCTVGLLERIGPNERIILHLTEAGRKFIISERRGG